ncbi:MAG: EAL domain-containing protein [Agathobacter sp.]|nr:EAL domain-containing protein [Agathobacter sp.]
MNIQVQVCGLIIMLFLFVFYKSSNTLKLYTEKVFHQAMYTSMLCLSLDILSVVVIQYRSALPILFVEAICKLYIITLVWVSMYAFVYVLTDLFSEERHIRWSRIIKGIVLAQSILVYILPIGIFAEGRVVYTYGDAVLAVYGSVAVYILATLVTIGVRFKVLNKRRAAAVALWMLVYICAAIIQFMNNELLLVGFASAIGLLILFVVMENPEANLDRRIGCFNAYALSEYIGKLLEKKKSFSVMEVSFKDLEYLEEHGVFVDQVLRNVVALSSRDTKGKVFKDINSNIVVITENDLVLQNAAESILSNFAEDNLLRKNIKIIILRDGMSFPNMDEMSRFFTFLRQSYSKELDGILLADDTMIAKYMEKYIVEEKIDAALKEDRVEVFFQPIYSNAEESFTSAEALVRIREVDGSLMSPGAFIPVAESNGQIVELGERVFELVCKFIKEQDMDALGLHYIEVNLSVIQCQMTNLAEQLIAIAEKYQVNPAQINLEITETGSISARNVLLRNMENLIAYGFSFSLDDFGKGESNLMYVVEMPVSIVKLDYDMSKAYFNTERAKHVLKAVVGMAHGMKLKLVAEGIETIEELEGMHQEGIDYIQGYYYSRPIPEVEFIEFVKQQNG